MLKKKTVRDGKIGKCFNLCFLFHKRENNSFFLWKITWFKPSKNNRLLKRDFQANNQAMARQWQSMVIFIKISLLFAFLFFPIFASCRNGFESDVCLLPFALMGLIIWMLSMKTFTWPKAKGGNRLVALTTYISTN